MQAAEIHQNDQGDSHRDQNTPRSYDYKTGIKQDQDQGSRKHAYLAYSAQKCGPGQVSRGSVDAADYPHGNAQEELGCEEKEGKEKSAARNRMQLQYLFNREYE